MVLLSHPLRKETEKQLCSRKGRKKRTLEGRANWLYLCVSYLPGFVVVQEPGGLLSDDGLWVYGPRKKGPTCSRDQVIVSDSPWPQGPRDPGTHHKMLRHVSNTCQLSPSGTWVLSMKEQERGAEGRRPGIGWSVRADSGDDFEGQPGRSCYVSGQVPKHGECSSESWGWTLSGVSQAGKDKTAPGLPSFCSCPPTSLPGVWDVCFPRTAQPYMWEEGKDCWLTSPLGQSPYCSLESSKGFRKEAMKSFPLD